jgi:phenylalanyl-tRNA synthetase beta subunit
MEKLNKNSKIQGNKNREALKKLLKSTKTNQKQSNEYMNAFEKGRKTFKELKENITMKAKRNALVRKIDKKPVKNENENEAMEASRLFNVGGGVKNLTRGKERA